LTAASVELTWSDGSIGLVGLAGGEPPAAYHHTTLILRMPALA